MIDSESLKQGSHFQDKYRIESVNLSKIPAAYIFKVFNESLKRYEILKIDLKSSGRVKEEFEIMRQLSEIEGIPHIYDSNFGRYPEYFTEEAYHADLNTLSKQYKQFDLPTTVSIYLQLMIDLEALHDKNIIHGNISPKRVVVTESKTRILLVDFINAIDYKNPKHIKPENRNKSDLSCSFSSLSVHNGICTFKDDIESLVYMIIFLLTGKLPWKSAFPKNTFSKWQKVFIMKRSANAKEISQNCPKEFENLIIYARKLKDNEKPDYSYLKSLLLQTIPVNLVNKFMWNSKKKKKLTKKKSLKKKQSNLGRMKTQNMNEEEDELQIQNKRIRSKSNFSKVPFEIVDHKLSTFYEATIEDESLPEFKDRGVIMESRSYFFKELGIKLQEKRIELASCNVV